MGNRFYLVGAVALFRGNQITRITFEVRNEVGLQLGRWFSPLTPNGAFRHVPVDLERYGIDRSVAQELIELIRRGQSLPHRLVRILPEI